jgi:hypothetical protein
VRTGEFGVGLGSIGPGEVGWGAEVPEAFGPDFTGVTVPQSSPSDVEGESVEMGAGGRGG